MSDDPYRFTDPATMGAVYHPVRSYARCALLDAQGNVVPVGDPDPIPLDVWRHVIDPLTKQPTGHVRRERMRALGEVFQDLHRRLDVVACDHCGFERPRQEQDYCRTHEGCG